MDQTANDEVELNEEDLSNDLDDIISKSMASDEDQNEQAER